VRYPAFSNVLFFLARALALLDLIRPSLPLNKSFLVKPPEVLSAVPCHTCALDPTVILYFNIDFFLSFN
tara:strand:+ start:4207 stop:4413 length:207 start_codon:yes stop_codon:yes gene_type:complete